MMVFEEQKKIESHQYMIEFQIYDISYNENGEEIQNGLL